MKDAPREKRAIPDVRGGSTAEDLNHPCCCLRPRLQRLAMWPPRGAVWDSLAIRQLRFVRVFPQSDPEVGRNIYGSPEVPPEREGPLCVAAGPSSFSPAGSTAGIKTSQTSVGLSFNWTFRRSRFEPEDTGTSTTTGLPALRLTVKERETYMRCC